MKGIILEVEDMERLDQLLQDHNDHLLHPFLRLSIEKETSLFLTQSKTFAFTHSGNAFGKRCL